MVIGAVVALGMLFPIASLATNDGKLAEPAKQAGEDRWVPSLAITSGITIQQQRGSADSCFFSDPEDISRNCDSNVDPPLRGFVKGDDLAVSPFVGGSLELMGSWTVEAATRSCEDTTITTSIPLPFSIS